MIQLAIALLIGFLLGWLALLKKEISFDAASAVVLLSLLESVSYGWFRWRKSLLDAERKSLNIPVLLHLIIGILFGLCILSFGDAIGQDLRLVATIPLAMVFLANLYKIVSLTEK